MKLFVNGGKISILKHIIYLYILYIKILFSIYIKVRLPDFWVNPTTHRTLNVHSYLISLLSICPNFECHGQMLSSLLHSFIHFDILPLLISSCVKEYILSLLRPQSMTKPDTKGNQWFQTLSTLLCFLVMPIFWIFFIIIFSFFEGSTYFFSLCHDGSHGLNYVVTLETFFENQYGFLHSNTYACYVCKAIRMQFFTFYLFSPI